MTFIDLFAGIGGFRRGLELAGHKCVGFCEWDKYAAASYISMHLITNAQRAELSAMSLKQRQKEILKEVYRNGEFYSNDVRFLTADNIPRADCWTFGAPCQDFSVAGKRKGLEGDRSSLVRQIFRILSELKEENKPEWLVYENVKGMLSSNRGFDFLAILVEMGDLGYDIEWELFNTKNFGIPQNRERVYVIGHLRSKGRKQIFPLKRTSRKDNNSKINFDPDKCEMFGIDFNPQGEPRQIANTVMSRYYKGMAQRRRSETAVVIPVATVGRATKDQNGRRFKENNEPQFTLTVQDQHGVALGFINPEQDGSCRTIKAQQAFNTASNFVRTDSFGATGVEVAWYEKANCYVAIRKLTPKECFRLQGWSDDYFEKAAFVNFDSQLYKQAGNGVTVAVVEEIGKAIKEVENE